jgi:ubiquinol-cytochrome c reductase cytochrome c subunit
MSRAATRLAAAATALARAAAAVLVVAPGLVLGETGGAPAASHAARIARGRALFVAGCSSCHGFDARGIRGVAPSLHGAGAAAADFYLRTGRMPLTSPDQEPQRSEPAYPPGQIADLVAYVGSLGGPPVPRVRTSGANLSDGQRLFADNCSGCHQIVGRGGIVTGAFVPSLVDSTPAQVAEAARIGPYLMPRFGPGQLSARELADIAGYVLQMRHPADHGGWGIGHIGPVPEGMITWLLAIPLLLLLTRVIGERTER